MSDFGPVSYTHLISSVFGIVGTMFSGVISDRFFGGRRNIPALIFGLMNVFALCLFRLVPGVHFWMDALAMMLFGLGIGVLICFLGGLMAVDIAPRNASGAALGVVGIASYIGAGLQDVMSGVSVSYTHLLNVKGLFLIILLHLELYFMKNSENNKSLLRRYLDDLYTMDAVSYTHLSCLYRNY